MLFEETTQKRRDDRSAAPDDGKVAEVVFTLFIIKKVYKIGAFGHDNKGGSDPLYDTQQTDHQHFAGKGHGKAAQQQYRQRDQHRFAPAYTIGYGAYKQLREPVTQEKTSER